MKKLLFVLLVLLTGITSAAQQVSIVWPFNIGSNQANFVRAIIDQANKDQNKYVFILENKVGAGGVVASQHVLKHTPYTLLSMSSSFFLRPVYYPNESYRVEDFKPVMIECTGQPVAILSNKYKTLAELKTQKRLTIGMVLGGITEAMAKQLQAQLPGVELVLVPYPGTIQATQDLVGGHVDLAVEFAADSKQWIDDGKLFALGISGIKDRESFKSFHSQSVKGFENLVSNYQILASAEQPEEITEELHAILRQAANNSPVLKSVYARDYCNAVDLNPTQTQERFKEWSKFWPTIK
jgi:hypothetical protein